MSVKTPADERIEEAREHTTKATFALAEVVINECSGAEEFTAEARAAFEKAFDLLREAKKTLARFS